ncbi:choice-of-anchor L domain-containing protein [Agarivorans albus]|uniref:PEP-CTERM protein-sorting domain-containing protein n=1 Tax=Agarivorans albus MKT 106 TaxID=1331007 RepID=R9PM76_AGAAL|nr:choice-of-anchor L domain-containing protein [Agarivorans albus]GAD02469.1 hypothetical protein AALB_2549 [Agarivorans albus MKT 106]
MNKKVLQASLVSLAIGTLYAPMASAIVITESFDAMELAESLLVPDSSIVINSATLSQSGLGQAGTFTNESGVYGIPSEGGVVLSSGLVKSYEDGPNTDSGFTGSFDTAATAEQNAMLTPLTGIQGHFDPVQLDISFTVNSVDPTTLTFFGVFGSEEWPEFVGGTVTDGFGLFLNGENIAGALPTGSSAGDPLLPINIDHPDMSDIRGTELDGVLAPNGNPQLRFDAPVQPGVNTFTFILADAGDSVLDTTIFLSSFGELGESEFVPILPDPSNPTDENGAFVFDLPEVQSGETIWIDPDVAAGYVYSTDGMFASVTAPSLASVNDPDGYVIEFLFEGVLQQIALAAGETFEFGINFDPVSTFTLSGINLDLGLDPTSPLAFVTGLSFVETGSFQVSQLPVTVFVPDNNSVPESPTLFMFGLVMAFWAGRKKLSAYYK